MNDERPVGWSRRRKMLVYGTAAVLAVLLALLLVWLFVWRSEAPPPPSVLERSEALTATAAQPSPMPPPAEPAPAPAADPPSAADLPPPPPEPSPPPDAPAADLTPTAEPPPPDPPAETSPPPEPPPPPTAAPDDPATPEGVSLDGVWSVDVTLGSFDDYSSSWAGYRVGEELSGIGTTEAVGRTPAVSGTLEIVGLTAVAATVEVDLTTVVSDRPQRDGLVRRALDTQQFPSARFELTEPVTFVALPTPDEDASQVVDGTFTVHGVTRPVKVLLTAAWIEDIIIVGGAFEIRFEDYGINPPRAPVVLSVEDTAAVELLLNFTR